MGALTFIDAAPRYERRGDNAVMILTSNGVDQEFIMSINTLNKGIGAAVRSMRGWQEELRLRTGPEGVVLFPTPKKRRKSA